MERSFGSSKLKLDCGDSVDEPEAAQVVRDAIYERFLLKVVLCVLP
jgi:hypothetical protein